MAKKRRKSSSKCPEPFNVLIDLAAGITMNAIANKMEDKHHYRKRGVPNPYRASAIGFVTGKLKSTSQILKLGGLLGAMGSFDDGDSDYIYSPPRPPRINRATPWEYDNIGSVASTKNNNKYAWRMNCEDGSIYGLNPLDYETRDDYNIALNGRKLMNNSDSSVSGTNSFSEKVDVSFEKCDSRADKYTYYRASRLDNGINDYYYSKEKAYRVGDTVKVETVDGTVKAIIISVEEGTRNTLPKALEDMELIIE